MLSFWCLVLLGGFLPPSQGVSLAGLLVPAQPKAGLLGTGLPSGEGLISKKDGLLGTGLLGEGGVLGTGLLGKGSPSGEESGGSLDSRNESSRSGILGTGLLGEEALLDMGVLGRGGLLSRESQKSNGGLTVTGGLSGSSGILGGKGLGNGLLGNDILEKNSLLGDKGLLGTGLLGKGGTGTGILGGEGLGNGLLGNGILENNSLLGEKGLLGTGLLGKGGTGTGILGGEGLGNGLLGNGLLSNGLLGNNSLLGEKGLLGTGLLGKGGLIGNGSLLGLDGLLGEGLLGGGLLGNGIPQVPTRFGWLKVLNLENVRVSWQLLRGGELVLNLYSKLVLRFPGIFNFLSGTSVETNVTSHIALTQDTPGDLKLVIKDCNNLLGDVSINTQKGFLTSLVSRLLNYILRWLVPVLLCPVVNSWVSIINMNLQLLNRFFPFGLLGKLYSAVSNLPVTSHHVMELDLQNSPFPTTFINWLLQTAGISLGNIL